MQKLKTAGLHFSTQERDELRYKEHRHEHTADDWYDRSSEGGLRQVLGNLAVDIKTTNTNAKPDLFSVLSLSIT